MDKLGKWRICNDTFYIPPYPHLYSDCMMSESYSSKRERWQRMLQSLPVGLREHVSLRNLERVASLTPAAQQRLSQAIQSGLRRLHPAIEQLTADPDTSVEDLLHPASQTVKGTRTPKHIQEEIADLIQTTFPDMPRVSAEALAGSDAMAEVRTVAWAIETLLLSLNQRADFVLLVFMAHMCKVTDSLSEIADKSPALKAAYKRPDLHPKSDPRSK